MTGYYAQKVIGRIKVARGIDGSAAHAACSKAIASIPERYCELIDYLGTKIHIVDWVPDYNAAWKSMVPPGFRPGTNYYHTAGCYDIRTNTAIVALRSRHPQSGEIMVASPEFLGRVVAHELGHAFENLAKARPYFDMRELAQSMDNDLREKGNNQDPQFAVYYPKENGGSNTRAAALSEILAECLADTFLKTSPDEMWRKFPRCWNHAFNMLEWMRDDFEARHYARPAQPTRQAGRRVQAGYPAV